MYLSSDRLGHHNIISLSVSIFNTFCLQLSISAAPCLTFQPRVTRMIRTVVGRMYVPESKSGACITAMSRVPAANFCWPPASPDVDVVCNNPNNASMVIHPSLGCHRAGIHLV